MFSAFFLGALYLERVLGYNAIDTGLAFMPLTIAIAAFSMGISALAVGRFGALRTLAAVSPRSPPASCCWRRRACTRATSPACSSRSC